MARFVVLVRHGKARRPDGETPEELRELTRAGARAFCARLPVALDLLDASVGLGSCAGSKEASLALWSSPAARAQQTAGFVSAALERCYGIHVDPQPMECLIAQDADAFLAAVLAEPCELVIAVGHNPFVEDLTGYLADCLVNLSTGGMVALRLDAAPAAAEAAPAVVLAADEAEPIDDPDGAEAASDAATAVAAQENPPALHARLLWVLQGPEQERWQTLCQLEKALRQCCAEIPARRQAFFDDPDDPEALHRFRISVRTLRGLVAFLSPFQNRRQNRAVKDALRTLAAQTSLIRELDVLAEQAAQMEDVSEELEQRIALERDAECARVRDALGSKDAERLLRKVERAIDGFSWKRAVESQGLPADEVRERFDALQHANAEWLERVDFSNREETHDLRKQVKLVRYVAARNGSVLGEDAKAVESTMKSRQDRLGAVCDAWSTMQVIDEFNTEGLSDRAVWDLLLLRSGNERFLLQTLRGAEVEE